MAKSMDARKTAKKEPLKTPCFFKAIIPYSEHVGVCLQLPPNKGDIKIL